ncbi:hypothetical protein FQZ97_754270 [compost metagenome]
MADLRQATVQRFALTLQQSHRDAGIGEVHGDTTAHGAGADHCDLADGAGHGAGVDPGHLAGFTLGEEHVAQRLRLARGFSVLEQRDFPGQAFLQREQAGGFHCREHQARRQAALPAWFVLFTEAGEEVFRQPLGRLREGGRWTCRRLAGDEFTGIGAGFIQQRFGACREPVEHALGKRAFGADLGAGQHHVERRLRADQSRQALGAAGAGEQAQSDFRQANSGARFSDTVATGQGQFQAAAEGQLADGCHQGLVQAGQAQQQAGQVRGGERSVAAEFADIGAGAEQAVGAMDDYGLDLRVGCSALGGVEHGGAQGLPEGIDRRTG